MTVEEYLNEAGGVRYLLRDVAKTRYSDALLLNAFNKAVKRTAEDTFYYHGLFELRIHNGVTEHEFDDRILYIYNAYVDDCKQSILTDKPTRCPTPVAGSLVGLSVSYAGTRMLHSYPELTNITSYSKGLQGIAIEYDLDVVGPQLYVDEQGNASVILAEVKDYIPVALEVAYKPEPFTLASALDKTTIELQDIIGLRMQADLTIGSSVSTTQRQAKEAEAQYSVQVKRYKKMRVRKFAAIDYTVKYKTPFGKRKHSKGRDF